MAIQPAQYLLQGAGIQDVTSLQFGPDGRLYAAQDDGILKVFTVAKTSTGYAVTATETIDLVQDIVNHNDDGSVNTAITARQVTGILVTGTAASPVVYVSSSDPRIGAGPNLGDTNLDTNSGVVSRLTRTDQGWQKLDLVRGLPRSEENHATNGMYLDQATGTLYLTQGGHTNAGAPSHNFAYIAGIRAVGRGAEGGPERDQRDVDPGRQPGPGLQVRPAHGGRSDARHGDERAWGGNDGLNQARLVAGGPVQVFSPGFRNAYDLAVTANGMYTWDNGANPTWGGVPINEGTPNVTNQPNDTSGQTNNAAGLYRIFDGFYGGHPNPIRANPSGAGLYDESGRLRTLPSDWPPVPVSMADPRQGDYRLPGPESGALITFPGSLNGLTEYTASALNGAMKGNLLVASLNTDSIYRIVLGANGQQVVSTENITPTALIGPGQALDVTARGDGQTFAGTIWVGSYGGGITVLDPGGAAPPPPSSDDDKDGLNNVIDRFALDPANGMQTLLDAGQTLSWAFSQNITPPGPSGSLFNIGFTGAMVDLAKPYTSLYRAERIVAGGAAAGVLIQDVAEGSAHSTRNTQLDALQFGLATGSNVHAFRIEAVVDNPFDAVTSPANYQNFGFYIGTGDQDHYLKLVAGANNGPSFEVVTENMPSIVGQRYGASIYGPAQRHPAGHHHAQARRERRHRRRHPELELDPGQDVEHRGATPLRQRRCRDADRRPAARRAG